MKALIDTNVVLDLLLDREPWSEAATQIFSKAEAGVLEGYLCATTVTTVYYLARRVLGAKRAQHEVRKLLSLCGVAPVNRPVLEAALVLDFSDFEDAVIHEAARHTAVEVIVTRDVRDFSKAALRILTPEECIRILRR